LDLTHLALLRGINVGGKASLPMRELTAIFAALGARSVRTYIQSGNVLFDAPDPASLVLAVTSEIAARFGYPGRIVLRSATELRDAFAHNPFVGSGSAAPESLHVYFLADRPSPAAVQALDPKRSPGDTFVVREREIFLHLPSGMARTRLTNAYFDAQLKTVSTARNWKTVGKLVEMLDEPTHPPLLGSTHKA
jgi:uncharacterized protein (DUF1697 family)